MNQVGTDVSGKWMGISQAEKFAELIVQECINACGSDFGTELIKKHFRVEE